ncbi:MAG: hypothetical protein JW861_14550 [Bacteroidales bacterium]|nr:hypothetical protein [Bacteroidales bacterium]
MSYRIKSAIYWLLALVITLSAAMYQRMTGPSYPIRGKAKINGIEVRYKFITTAVTGEDAGISIRANDSEMGARLLYQRYRMDTVWTIQEMGRDGDFLLGSIPGQPPAGKMAYRVLVIHDGRETELYKEPIVIRFKGSVPLYILLPHIILIFLAMLFSVRTGIEALIWGKKVLRLTQLTVILLLLGGMIMGPVVQKYSFGAFWTGWPFGDDLTDNKTLVAFIFWVIAWIMFKRNINRRGWVIAASLILLAVYLIPHSLLGSELDYSTGEVVTGNH